jgi:hypothetical protein
LFLTLPNHTTTKKHAPCASRSPFKKGEKPLKIKINRFSIFCPLIFRPLFEGGAAIAAGGERSEGLALIKKAPLTKGKQGFFLLQTPSCFIIILTNDS